VPSPVEQWKSSDELALGLAALLNVQTGSVCKDIFRGWSMSLGVRDHPCKKCIHICPAKAGQATGRSSAWLLFETLPQLHMLTVGARAFSSFFSVSPEREFVLPFLFRLYPSVAHSCTVLLMPHLMLHDLPLTPTHTEPLMLFSLYAEQFFRVRIFLPGCPLLSS